MKRPRVYVETTIPSAYYPLRNSAQAVEERDLTRRWWTRANLNFELVTAVPVIEEIENGSGPNTLLRLRLLSPMPKLGQTVAVSATVDELIRHRVMPADPPADAYHLALAMHYHCGVLITWDRKHLANPNKFTHINRIAQRLGLRAPAILTPREHLERIG